jgi:hypothetical protein
MSISTNFDAINNNVDDVSFGLLRTNPKLTTNIKLVVNSEGSLYMDAIAANKSLSNNSFKNYAIHSDGKYSNDVALFYGNTPNELKYDVLRDNSDLSVYREYSKQYEDSYQYGAYFNASKTTTEQYRFFAPIWLEKKIPSHFVIYRVEGVDYSEQLDNTVASQNSRILELLKNATIVKTFDLTTSSKLGKYLSNHVNDSKFPNGSITQNFDVKQPTSFNGIDITNGGFVNKKDYINSDLVVDKIEILNNYILTSGFQRNELAVANIINLEFLFDDENADNYSIYRYFGLYVDAIEEGEFTAYSIVSNSIQIENDSIKTYYDISNSSLTHNDMFLTNEDLQLPTLNWVKDGFNNFYHIKNNTNFRNSSPISLPVSINQASLSNFINKTNVGSIQLESFLVDLKDVLSFNITEAPHNGDKLFLTAKSELIASNYKLHNFEFVAESELEAGKYLNNTYSSNGTLEEIAAALAGAITASEIPYTAKRIGEKIIIEDYGVGNTRKLTAFGILNGNISNFIDIEAGLQDNIGLNLSDWTIWTPIGGATKNNCVLVNNTHLGNLKVGDYLQGVNTSNYSKIIQIVKDPYELDLYRVILESNIEVPRTKSLNIYVDYKTKYGKFSAYSLKDFDFDFHDTSNSELGELAFEDLLLDLNSYNKYEDACNAKFKERSEDYYPTLYPVLEQELVNKRDNITSFSQEGDINIKDVKISSEYDRLFENQLKETATFSRISPTVNKFALKDSFNARMKPYLLTYSEAFGSDNMSPVIMTGKFRDPIDYSMEYFHINSIPSLYESDPTYIKSLKSYVGFNTSITNELTPDNLKSIDNNYFEKFFIWDGAYSDAVSIESIQTSGTVTLVNFSGDINPDSISGNKLTAYNGQEYILPSNIIYSPNNGSVISFVGTQDPNNLLSIGDTFEAKNTEFVKAKSHKLYTKFNDGSPYNFSSTVFRGLRYTFKSRKENRKSNPTEFKQIDVNGYKFGVVINLENDASVNDVSYEVIKNDAYKFICVYINLRLQTNDVTELTRKVLYELRHAFLDGKLVDVPISGALNLRAADWKSANKVTIKGIPDKFGNLPQFENQINVIQSSDVNGYSYLLFDWYNYITDQIEVKALKVVNVLNNNTIQVAGYPVEWNTTTNTPGVRWTKVSNISNALQGTLTYRYYNGGYDAFREILESIKAKNFSDSFNNNSSNIAYTSIAIDGSISTNDFVLNVEDGTSFIKPSFIKASVDADKPLSYKITPDDVGRIITQRDTGYTVELRRMNGTYNPLTNDVISFTDIYTEYKAVSDTAPVNRNKLIYDKFNRLGISFATYFTEIIKPGHPVHTPEYGYGIIKNYYYHKVNPESPDTTLKLSKASDKLPLYPKIGEIAIDKKDLNILESKYSQNYFTKSSPNGGTNTEWGTMSPIEKRAFMASTIMKTEAFYDITNFTTETVGSLEELNSIKLNNNANASIIWTETDERIYADFYVKRSVLNELVEQGIKDFFDNYVTPAKSFGDLTTTEDDLQEYVEWNIVPRFNIDSIEFFAKEAKNIDTDFLSANSATDIDLSIYKPQTNYIIESFATDGLSFRLIYNKRYGYSYQFKTMVKIRA